MATIVYESRTGNVSRFLDKVSALRPDWNVHMLSSHDSKETYEKLSKPFHIVTFTTKFGEVPDKTCLFINAVGIDRINTVASSGNRNWGTNFGMAANKIAMLQTKYEIPTVKFELSGISEDVRAYIKMVEDNSFTKQLHTYP